MNERPSLIHHVLAVALYIALIVPYVALYATCPP